MITGWYYIGTQISAKIKLCKKKSLIHAIVPKCRAGCKVFSSLHICSYKWGPYRREGPRTTGPSVRLAHPLFKTFLRPWEAGPASVSGWTAVQLCVFQKTFRWSVCEVELPHDNSTLWNGCFRRGGHEFMLGACIAVPRWEMVFLSRFTMGDVAGGCEKKLRPQPSLPGSILHMGNRVGDFQQLWLAAECWLRWDVWNSQTSCTVWRWWHYGSIGTGKEEYRSPGPGRPEIQESH